MTSPPAPRVSICVLAYNHGPFVEEALRSVLAQDRPFPHEIVFADDCSTDGTKEIAARIAREHPTAPFRFLPRHHNLGMEANFLGLLEAARGEYVAYLESDDAWVDRSRLAEQVALLHANPHLSGCFGRATVVDASGQPLGDYFDYHRIVPSREADQRTTIEFGTVAPACTMVFRRSAIAHPPEWFRQAASHQALGVLLTGHGPLAFVDRHWGRYRVHEGGVWSLASNERRRAANFRYALALARDSELMARYPREVGARLVLATAAHVRAQSRKGLSVLPTIARQLGPLAHRHSAVAVARAFPDLAESAMRKARAYASRKPLRTD